MVVNTERSKIIENNKNNISANVTTNCEQLEEGVKIKLGSSRVVSYQTRKCSLLWSFFADSYLYGVSEQIQLGCPSGNLGQLFLFA